MKYYLVRRSTMALWLLVIFKRPHSESFSKWIEEVVWEINEGGYLRRRLFVIKIKLKRLVSLGH